MKLFICNYSIVLNVTVIYEVIVKGYTEMYKEHADNNATKNVTFLSCIVVNFVAYIKLL